MTPAEWIGIAAIVVPLLGLIERPKKVPGSITEDVLGPEGTAGAAAAGKKG